MICPSCGAEVAETKFCENCGNPLPSSQAQVAEPAQEAYPFGQPAMPSGAACASPVGTPYGEPANSAYGAPVGTAYGAEAPGDAAWQSQPQQVYQASQTVEMPPQPDAGGYAPSAGSPQPPYGQSAPYQAASSGNKAPAAAFVLVIVGLVLSIMFVTAVPGIVCSIIGLVLNAGYNSRGLDNPHRTSTMVLGIIGIIIAVLCILFTIVALLLAVSVADEMDRQGVAYYSGEGISITTDSNGVVNVTVTDSSDSGAASSSATPASPESTGIDYYDSKFHDSQYNPTLYPIVELTGAQMCDLLEQYHFAWDDDSMGFEAADGAMFAVRGVSGDLTDEQIRGLPQGAAGEAIAIGMAVEGYLTPSHALSELTADVSVEKKLSVDDVTFAVVYGSPLVRYLVVVSDLGAHEQGFMLFTEQAIADGLFAEIIGFDAGSTIDDVWQLIEASQ